MKNKTGFLFIVSILLICPPLFAEQTENKPLPAVNQQQDSAKPAPATTAAAPAPAPAKPSTPTATSPSAAEPTPPPQQEVKEPVKESKKEKAAKEPKKKTAKKKSEAPASSTQDGSVIPAAPKAETPPAEVAQPAQPAAEPATPSVVLEADGIYRSGSAPLKNKSKIKMSWNGEVFSAQLVRNLSASVWKITIKELRGAKSVADGLWIYWYDTAGSTLSAYIDTGKEPTEFVESINKSLADYYSLEKRIKTNFEAYKEQALKEAQ